MQVSCTEDAYNIFNLVTVCVDCMSLGHTNCLDSDVEEDDDDLTAGLVQNWKLLIEAKRHG